MVHFSKTAKFYLGTVSGLLFNVLLSYIFKKYKQYEKYYESIDIDKDNNKPALPQSESDKIVKLPLSIAEATNNALTKIRGGDFGILEIEILVFYIFKVAIAKIQLLPNWLLWLLQNDIFRSFAAMLLGPRVFGLTFGEMSEICADSCPSNIGGKELANRTKNWILTSKLLEQCPTTIKDLERFMENSEIPHDEKIKHAGKIFGSIESFNNSGMKQVVIVCIVTVLVNLYSSNIGGFFLSIKALVNAWKSGKISNALFRLLLRKLKRKGIPVGDYVDD